MFGHLAYTFCSFREWQSLGEHLPLQRNRTAHRSLLRLIRCYKMLDQYEQMEVTSSLVWKMYGGPTLKLLITADKQSAVRKHMVCLDSARIGWLWY
jgi:hypothetical protein